MFNFNLKDTPGLKLGRIRYYQQNAVASQSPHFYPHAFVSHYCIIIASPWKHYTPPGITITTVPCHVTIRSSPQHHHHMAMSLTTELSPHGYGHHHSAITTWLRPLPQSYHHVAMSIITELSPPRYWENDTTPISVNDEKRVAHYGRK